MISIKSSFFSSVKMADRSIASLRMPGVSHQGTGLSGVRAVRPASFAALAGFSVRERDERPTKALGAVAAQAQAYAFAATGAENRKQTTQHHLMWAFRGPKPWSDPS
ncbi:hypothetical protein [Streptomyces thermoalcalitolerans]|uniref:Uncharacterized protein n=1 Tax=Streptomyces thermoalcalitolerans TaxID=65605 RepID=A0ABP3ZSP0_9ACTN